MPNDENSDACGFGPVDDRIRKPAEREDLPSVFCRGADSRKLFQQFGDSLKVVQKPPRHSCADL